MRKSAIAIAVITFGLLGCKTKQYKIQKHTESYVVINPLISEDTKINDFIEPYRNHINQDLAEILAYNPQRLDKAESKWQNQMTNFFADAVLETAQPTYVMQTSDSIQACLLNYGGIRSAIGKGDITKRTAYEIMPFENQAIVLQLSGEQIYELAQFILDKKTAHPLSGIKIYVENNAIKSIKINNKEVEKDKTYHLVTNDYLAKGGDWMTFLTKAQKSTDLNLKLRDLFVTYFTKIDTLKPSTEPRIIFQ